MENVLFSQKRGQDVHKRGGLEILLVSYPVLFGESPLVEHCNALILALRDYAKGEPLQIALVALDEAIKSKNLCSFSRHHLQIDLKTVLKNEEILCTLSLSLSCKKQILFERKLSLFWDKAGQFQKKRPRRQKASRFSRQKQQFLP